MPEAHNFKALVGVVHPKDDAVGVENNFAQLRLTEFRQAVEEGLASLDRGERIPLDEVRKRIPQWVSKYSSPVTP